MFSGSYMQFLSVTGRILVRMRSNAVERLVYVVNKANAEARLLFLVPSIGLGNFFFRPY